ncbi:MAG: hypothetical protein EAY81_11295 [Bacteroidetes bacterium]|nr:MAG: hypothetical protein EAY81_11295 [Bacteroidota bacterium]
MLPLKTKFSGAYSLHGSKGTLPQKASFNNNTPIFAKKEYLPHEKRVFSLLFKRKCWGRFEENGIKNKTKLI